jgi:Cys-rich protein (TIGR01571 family)
VQKGAYAIIVGCIFILWLLSFILFVVAGALSDNPNSSGGRITTPIMGIFFFILVMIIRQKVRELYGIQPQCCGGCEDCCCAWWCTPCTICQIWRHVQDPRISNAQGCCGCASKDGLPATFNLRAQKQAWYPNRQSVGGAQLANIV